VYFCRKGNRTGTPVIGYAVNKQVKVETQQTPMIPPMNGELWHALYVMPRSEKKVAEKLQAKGLEVFVPLVESIRFWSDRKKKVKLPLISGVVFIRIVHAQLSLALNTLGVVNVIRYLGKPAIIRDFEIENLRILVREQTGFTFLSEEPHFDEGEPVLVNQGSFYGLIGQFIRTQGQHRVVVELQALNSYIEVNIPVSFLEKIAQQVA
jgi:transcriptional antiterminator NusG